MTPEEKELLQKTYALAKENNEMLHSMRRSMRVSTTIRVIYWGLIILGTIGVTVYVGPILSSVYGSYQNILQEVGGGGAPGRPSANSLNPLNTLQQLKELTK